MLDLDPNEKQGLTTIVRDFHGPSHPLADGFRNLLHHLAACPDGFGLRGIDVRTLHPDIVTRTVPIHDIEEIKGHIVVLRHGAFAEYPGRCSYGTSQDILI